MGNSIITQCRKADGADYLKTVAGGANQFVGIGNDGELAAFNTDAAMLARQRNGRTRRYVETQFDLLPGATVAAGKDPYFLEYGVNTEVIGAAAKGGLSLTTAASEDDNAAVVGSTASSFLAIPINATALPVLTGRVCPVTVAACVVAFGFNENAGTEATTVLPTATNGDGAMFIFDPLNECTTGLAAAVYGANWVCAYKVNGTDTFADTGVAVTTLTDYELRIEIGSDFKPLMYINNVLVGTGPALTDGDTLKAAAGIQVGSGGGASEVRIRYITLSRAIA